MDAAGHARIVDFGHATVARDSKSLVSTTEEPWYTPRWTAPEILKGVAHHSKESDVFAFGMVVIEVRGHGFTPRQTPSLVYQVFTGKFPFSDCTVPHVIYKIVTGMRPERPDHPNLTNQLWKLTQRCWAEKPQDRPQIDSAIELLSVSFSIT